MLPEQACSLVALKYRPIPPARINCINKNKNVFNIFIKNITKFSGFWSQVSFKISVVTCLFFWGVIFSLPTSEILCDTCIRGYWNQTKFPIHKVWWLGEASQIRKTFIPLCKKVVYTQHGRIPIDPAILAAIGHCFIAIFKMPTRDSEPTHAETSRRLSFFGLEVGTQATVQR